jgi:hypothetical protein
VPCHGTALSAPFYVPKGPYNPSPASGFHLRPKVRRSPKRNSLAAQAQLLKSNLLANCFVGAVSAPSQLRQAEVKVNYRLREGAPSLNRESSYFFFFKRLPAASRSSYVSETNVVAKVTDSTINRTPCIAQAKPVEINRTFVFHPFLETTP